VDHCCWPALSCASVDVTPRYVSAEASPSEHRHQEYLAFLKHGPRRQVRPATTWATQRHLSFCSPKQLLPAPVSTNRDDRGA
jgi:hypothetical protein